MIQIVPQVKIFQHSTPVDFRKGIDGLAGIVRQAMRLDPLCGAMFAFINRRKTSVRVLVYDGQGFWLCSKRLSKGTFKFWLKRGNTQAIPLLSAPMLQALLFNGNPAGVQAADDWRKVSN